jgi:hypothetical protein
MATFGVSPEDKYMLNVVLFVVAAVLLVAVIIADLVEALIDMIKGSK